MVFDDAPATADSRSPRWVYRPPQRKRLTSWPSIRTDLENAGAQWVDEDVVFDGVLITSRGPDDLPAFTEAILVALGHSARH